MGKTHRKGDSGFLDRSERALKKESPPKKSSLLDSIQKDLDQIAAKRTKESLRTFDAPPKVKAGETNATAVAATAIVAEAAEVPVDQVVDVVIQQVETPELDDDIDLGGLEECVIASCHEDIMPDAAEEPKTEVAAIQVVPAAKPSRSLADLENLIKDMESTKPVSASAGPVTGGSDETEAFGDILSPVGPALPETADVVADDVTETIKLKAPEAPETVVTVAESEVIVLNTRLPWDDRRLPSAVDMASVNAMYGVKTVATPAPAAEVPEEALEASASEVDLVAKLHKLTPWVDKPEVKPMDSKAFDTLYGTPKLEGLKPTALKEPSKAKAQKYSFVPRRREPLEVNFSTSS